MKRFVLMVMGLVVSAGLVLADPIGMIVAIQGEASITDSAGKVRKLAMKSDIELNDTIKTGAKSRIQIMFEDDSLVGIGANSEMTIDEYVYNPDSAEDNAFGAKLGKGVFRTVSGKITEMNPDRFKVKTRRATIGIRGCDLGFDTTSDSQDEVSVISTEGHDIIITAVAGTGSLIVNSPTFVVVDDMGAIMDTPLTREHRQSIQQQTTPNAPTPETAAAEAAPVSAADVVEESGSLTQSTFTPVEDSSPVEDTVIQEEYYHDDYYYDYNYTP